MVQASARPIFCSFGFVLISRHHRLGKFHPRVDRQERLESRVNSRKRHTMAACSHEDVDPWIWVVVALVLAISLVVFTLWYNRATIIKRFKPRLPIFDDDQVVGAIHQRQL